MQKTIGILAGMGPRSTAPFLELVLDECQERYSPKYDDEFPAMMIYSLPTPFYLDKPMNQSALREAVCAGAKRLAASGVDFIAIPANSVHIFFNHIQEAAGVPILNIIDETVKHIPAETRCIALLATRMTLENGLYQDRLRPRNIEMAEISDLQPLVDELISAVKEGCDGQHENLKKLVRQCKEKKADMIINACTDLTPLTRLSYDLPIIDSSRALAKETVSRYLRK